MLPKNHSLTSQPLGEVLTLHIPEGLAATFGFSKVGSQEAAMLFAEETHKGKVMQVTGNPIEVAFFYSFWQSKLWSGWEGHEQLGQDGDQATRQHSTVIADIKEGKPLLLEDGSALFEDACNFAVGTCRKLGIEVEVDRLT